MKTLISINRDFDQFWKTWWDVVPVVAYRDPSFVTMPFTSYELNPPIEKDVMLLTSVWLQSCIKCSSTLHLKCKWCFVESIGDFKKSLLQPRLVDPYELS